jgi:hypothetical protein
MCQAVVPEEGDRENTVRTVERWATVFFGDAVTREGERENDGEVAIKRTQVLFLSIERKGGDVMAASEGAQEAADARMAQVILAPDVEMSKEVRGVRHGAREGGDAQAAKIVTAVQEGAREGADACVAREVSLRDVATSKEVAVVDEGSREAADGHTSTAREGAQEGEAGDVSSAKN